MIPPRHQNVLPTNDQPEEHADLIKRNERLIQELNSLQGKCDEYEKTILFQANEIRNLRGCLSLNICEQCKKKLDLTKSREIELCPAKPSSSPIVSFAKNPPQKLGGSHPPAAMFESKSRTRPSVPSSSQATPSRPASTIRQLHASSPNSLPSQIFPMSSTAFGDKDTDNVPSQPSQNLFRISHPGRPSLNDNGTNTLSQEQNWSIVFNRKVKKELDVKLIHTLPHREAVWRVRFSPEGKHLALACGKKADIYDVATGRLTCVLADLYEKRIPESAIQDLRFSPDGRYLATADWDQIYIWEISRKHVRNMFKQSMNRSLDFSSDGRLLVSASDDGSVRVCSMRDGGTSRVFRHARRISSAVFSLDGLYVITGDVDGMIRMWNLRTGHLIATVEAHNNWITCLALMPDGKGLVSGSWDKKSAYWDVGPLKTIQYLRPPREDKVSPKDGHSEGPERPENDIKLLRRFIGHTKAVWTVAISPNGRWIVSSSDDNSVGIWDAQNAAMHCMLQAPKGSVSSADVSRTGNYLAASCRDGQVGIWSYNKV